MHRSYWIELKYLELWNQSGFYLLSKYIGLHTLYGVGMTIKTLVSKDITITFKLFNWIQWVSSLSTIRSAVSMRFFWS